MTIKKHILTLLYLMTCFVLMAYHPACAANRVEDEKQDSLSLSVDGPYIVYPNKDSAQIIYVGTDGVITDTTVSRDNIENIDVYSHEKQKLFSVSLHPLFKTPNKAARANKVFVCSDPHGNFDSFVESLKKNGVINDNYCWSFKDNQLVIIGDVFDRGNDVLPLFWLIYKLEEEARLAGGQVFFLLGNHEHMVINNDLRYTESKYLNLAKDLELPYSSFFASNTELGQWLETRNVMLVLGDCLFVHAGISPSFYQKHWSPDTVNDLAQKGLRMKKADRKKDDDLNLLFGTQGPFWYRGLVRNQNEKYELMTSEQLDAILSFYGVNRIFVGHTELDEITSFFDGRVIGVNVNTDEHPTFGLMLEN